jgi:eukaryotic translation initiation factor 2C
MFKDLVEAWYGAHGRLPSNIIYYRDGVGDSQYADVLNKEVAKIETAFSAVKAEKNVAHIDKPRITVVIFTNDTTRASIQRATLLRRTATQAHVSSLE